MSRIIIQPYVPKGQEWISQDDVFRKVCKDVKKAFGENLPRHGWGEESTIDTFVVVRTSANHPFHLGTEMQAYSYTMGDGEVTPEQMLVAIETYSKNSGFCDHMKWRMRNAFGKMIDDANHPHYFKLETRVYAEERFDGNVCPVSPDDLFYIKGSGGFMKQYVLAHDGQPITLR